MVVNPDDDLEVFVEDMRTMSDFVYKFANMRNIVRKHEGTTQKDGLFGKPFKVEFDTPALIITQKGAQEKDQNAYLKYDITPAAINSFLEKNRKHFHEPSPGDYLKFDKTQTESEPFGVEAQVKDLGQDNMKIIDYEDKFSTEDGGLVYAVVLNITRKWVAVVFRGTIGATDAITDLDFRLNTESLFENDEYKSVKGGNPGTHMGFTNYLFKEREKDSTERTYVDRILACVGDEFANNPNVKGKGFKFYVSGHSLGGGLANLFAFRVAQLKSMGHESVKHLPDRVKAMSYASPCVGDAGYNKECQELEKKGFLRHIRIANEGDVVPTYDMYPPVSWAFKGDTSKFTQNGVNIFLKAEGKLVVDYRNTKTLWSQTNVSAASAHALEEYEKRMDLPENKEFWKQTIEELYQTAGDFNN